MVWFVDVGFSGSSTFSRLRYAEAHELSNYSENLFIRRKNKVDLAITKYLGQ